MDIRDERIGSRFYDSERECRCGRTCRFNRENRNLAQQKLDLLLEESIRDFRALVIVQNQGASQRRESFGTFENFAESLCLIFLCRHMELGL